MTPRQTKNLGLQEIVPYLESLRSQADRGIAIHFHLSKLLPYDHHAFQTLEIFSLLKQVFTSLTGKAFILKNDDLVYISFHNSTIQLERCLSQFKRMLSADSFIQSHLRADDLYTFHSLNHKFSEFQNIVYKIEKNALYQEQGVSTLHPPAQQNLPFLIAGINLETLSLIENTIKGADISIFLKRQPIVKFKKDFKPQIYSYHYYISVEALQSYLRTNEPIATNIWLFRQIGFYLDKQILAGLLGLLAQKNVPAINANLNLRTLMTTAFQNFIHKYDGSKPLTFDIDVVDFIAHPEAFEYALRMLKEKGCFVGLSGLTLKHVEYLNIPHLPVDSLKFVWDSQLKNHVSKLEEIVKRIGQEKVTLMKCDCENAIQTGLLSHITYFHGRGLDTFLEK